MCGALYGIVLFYVVVFFYLNKAANLLDDVL